MKISIHKCCSIKKKFCSLTEIEFLAYTSHKLNFIKNFMLYFVLYFMHKCHMYLMYASDKINLKNIYSCINEILYSCT